MNADAIFEAAVRKLHEYGEAALATRLDQAWMRLERAEAEVVEIRRAVISGRVEATDAKGSWLVLHGNSSLRNGQYVRIIPEAQP